MNTPVLVQAIRRVVHQATSVSTRKVLTTDDAWKPPSVGNNLVAIVTGSPRVQMIPPGGWTIVTPGVFTRRVDGSEGDDPVFTFDRRTDAVLELREVADQPVWDWRYSPPRVTPPHPNDR